jgi:pimeloyl-ACP methyl ester carboxylesterase
MLEASRRQYALAGLRGAALEHTLALLERLTRWIYTERLTPEQAFTRDPELRALESEGFHAERIYRRNVRFFQQLAALDVASAWRTITCPVLALHGSADYLGFPEHSAEVAALAPRGRYIELPDIDHMMHARKTLEEAFAETFTGTFNPAALEALVAFYRELL